MIEKRYAQERVLLETWILNPDDVTGPGIQLRLVDGPRPMGTGWQRLVAANGEWVPWAPSTEALKWIAIRLNNALAQSHADREAETKKLRQLLQDEKDARQSDANRNRGLAQEVEALRDQVATLNALCDAEDDGDMLLTLRSLVDSVEKVVNLLVIVEGWPDLGFLRYARADLTAALHHAKGQLTAPIEISRSRA